MSFQIADRVQWLKDTCGSSASAGIVLDILPNDQNLYLVKFDFGLRILHGSELTPTLVGISTCHEKEHLSVAQKKAFEIYMRGARELVSSVGLMAHADFDFLCQAVTAARHAAKEARQQLNQHIAEHGC